MISPQSVIEKYSVEEICQGAEEYFKSIEDVAQVMAKPFNAVSEAPSILEDVGVLLAGLRLGRTMSVLDFGSGACWLSRILSQLQCQTISCDPSQTALEIGARAFKDYPAPGSFVAEPRFLHFNGHTIDLPDKSVDRIVCFDAFHHVPNQEQILAEFARVLKDGGIAGFREPGRNHSQNAFSQWEMKNYVVLENDIKIDKILATALKYGFTDLRIRMQTRTEFTLEQYQELMELHNHSILNKKQREMRNEALANLRQVMESRAVFLLFKGATVTDSRSHEGLSCEIETPITTIDAQAGKELRLPVIVKNTGFSNWLHENARDIGVVKVGAHLYSENNELIDLDFIKFRIDRTIFPGESIHNDVPVIFSKPGKYRLVLDMVSEFITWFEHQGSKPLTVEVNVS